MLLGSSFLLFIAQLGRLGGFRQNGQSQQIELSQQFVTAAARCGRGVVDKSPIADASRNELDRFVQVTDATPVLFRRLSKFLHPVVFVLDVMAVSRAFSDVRDHPVDGRVRLTPLLIDASALNNPLGAKGDNAPVSRGHHPLGFLM
jgi:hypothetical protein